MQYINQKILSQTTDSPFYVCNSTLRNDINFSCATEESKSKYRELFDSLSFSSNSLLQNLISATIPDL